MKPSSRFATWTVLSFTGLVVLATVLPLVPSDHWFLTASVFPRIHFFLLGISVLILGASLWQRLGRGARFSLIAAAGAVIYQGVWIYPYTRLAKPQVQDSDAALEHPRISVLISNVFMENRRADDFLQLVESLDPDVVVTLEIDDWWLQQLQALEADRPHVIAEPLGNTYGVALHSRLEIQEGRVDYLVRDDTPSIFAVLRMDGRQNVALSAVHPRPPIPSGSSSAAGRNAEILLVAQREAERERPAIVVGDLNAVAWSSTTQLFQRISGLLDPRVGRGFHGTWNSNWPMLRFPLDHVFHDDTFELVRFEMHPVPGSDHLAVYVELALSEKAARQQDEPKPDPGDREEARAKIRKGQEATDG